MEGRKVYRCPVCGYEYVGDLESEPDDYVYPLCGQPKKPLSLKIGKVNRGNLIRKKSLTVFRLRAAHGSYRTRIKTKSPQLNLRLRSVEGLLVVLCLWVFLP